MDEADRVPWYGFGPQREPDDNGSGANAGGGTPAGRQPTAGGSDEPSAQPEPPRGSTPDTAAVDPLAAFRDPAVMAEDPLATAPVLALPALLRAARHYANLSQREFAERAGVCRSTVGDIESGRSVSPGYQLVLRLVEAAGLRLRVVDRFGMPLYPAPLQEARDAGGRHWPGHLDVRPVRRERDWWYGMYLTDMRPLPKFTADWERNRGKSRARRRTKAQREADAARRNTPPAGQVNGEYPFGG